jgi:hypothetical protein
MIYRYSIKPPSTKPPIYGCPHDGGECHSITQTCPNVSYARPMLLRHEWGGGHGESTTSGELTSGKLLDRQAWKSLALGVVLGVGTEENTYEQGGSGREEGK